MKHKLYNRLLSLALAVGLVAGMLPGVTFAGAVDSDATALQSQVEQIAEPTEEPETVSEESSQAEATPTPAPESSEEESSQVEETPAPTEEPVQEPENNEDTESAFIPPVNYTNVAPLFANLLKGVSAMGINTLADTPDTTESTQTDGLFLDKDSVATENGRGATITLNSYITGKVTTTSEKVPTDIVLVLDQSGSMAYDFGGGSHWEYTAVYQLNHNWTYYAGENHVRVTWCDDCQAWTNGCYDEGALWWKEHHPGTKYTPKTSANDNTSGRVQFYSYTEITNPSVPALDALTDAVESFVDSVEKEAIENEVDHRIAIVGFSSDEYDNTELLTGVTIQQGNTWYGTTPFINDWWHGTGYFPTGYAQNGVQYSNITQQQYRNALQDVSTEAGRTSVANAINALTAYGGTSTDDGLAMAKNIFDNQQATTEERNRVVIVFTDGTPSGSGSTFNSTVADNAINSAKSLKQSGVTVYTVGIFDGADGDPSTLPNNNDNGSNRENRFMHLVSSNYPNASSMTYTGGKAELEGDESYFLSAADSASLSEIFQKINDQITGEASVDLDETTEMRDVVSRYFTAPVEGTVKVYTEDYVGNDNTTDDTIHDNWINKQEITNQVDIDITGKTVTVKGFDYSKYFVSNTARPDPDSEDDTTADFYGKRLVVEFAVNAETAFWGGNKVPTNEASSGIYHKGEEMATYPVPTVDVKLNDFSVQAKDQNVYYKGSTPALTDLYIPVADFNPNNWTTDFVNLTYSFTNTSTTVSNTTDGTYGITATLSPTATGTYKDKTAADTASVNIFKPEITWKDTTKEAGTNLTTIDLTSENLVSKVWKHGDTVANNMFGAEPTLTYTFTNESDGSLSTSLATDEHVKVGVAINGTSVGTDVVTFDWAENPESSGCTACTKPDSYQFRIHVGNGDLTIIKQISGGTAPYDNAVFDFKIEAENGMVYYIHLDASSGTAQDTITLPTGDYTVTELDNLNYTPQGNSVREVTVGGNDATVTFTNAPTPTKIPSDSGATQNLPNWENPDGKLTWQKDEDLDGEPDTTTSN